MVELRRRASIRYFWPRLVSCHHSCLERPKRRQDHLNQPVSTKSSGKQLKSKDIPFSNLIQHHYEHLLKWF